MGIFLLVVVALLLVAPAAASAGDADSIPPRVELESAGDEGLVGPRSDALAYFSAPEGYETAAGYLPGSKVRFKCLLDGRPVKCGREYIETVEGGEGEFVSGRARPEMNPLPGVFIGWVPVPKRLRSGPHTVTVIGTDEDGTDLDPPSIEILFDRTPPSRPELLVAPPLRSRIHKPVFRFRSEDDIRFVRESDRDSFVGRLRRVRPNPTVFKGGGREAGSFEPWVRSCPSLLTCTGRAQVEYIVPGWSGLGLGMGEWLPAGLYELRLGARDAARNRSPLLRYRFRILRGRIPRR